MRGSRLACFWVTGVTLHRFLARPELEPRDHAKILQIGAAFESLPNQQRSAFLEEYSFRKKIDLFGSTLSSVSLGAEPEPESC